MARPRWLQLFFTLTIASLISTAIIFSPNQNANAQTPAPAYRLNNGRVDLIVDINDGRLNNVYFQTNEGRALATAAPDGAFNFTFQNAKNGIRFNISANQFRFNLIEQKINPFETQRLAFEGNGEWVGGLLKLRWYYELKPNEDFASSWFELDPVATPDWMMRYAAPQRWQMQRDMSVPAMIKDWYFLTRQRAPRGTTSTLLMTSSSGYGVYFFNGTPLAREYLNPLNYVMNLEQNDWQEVTQGFRTATAVIGWYQGGAEIGAQRFVNYVTKNYSLLNKESKKTPFYYSSWKVNTSDINEQLLLDSIDVVGQTGLHEMFHIDAGWEGGYPVEISKQKFPNGFDRINAKLNSYGMSMSLWINPYSNSYFGYTNYAPFHRDYRGWHVPELETLASEDGKLYYKGAFAVNSPYSDFVEERLVGLLTRYNIRQIYWDGSDWNIPESEVKTLSEDEADRRKVLGIKRLQSMVNRLHTIRPDLLIVGWNSWADPHLLGSLDQEQLSDIYQAQLGIAEIARRQLYYQVSYYMPFNTIWSDWYGLTYKERRDTANLNLPLDRLKFAELSMLNKGIKEAGAAFDLRYPRPDLVDFLRKLFDFRRQFDTYFEVYQPLLQRPDPARPAVDASAHITNGKGFVLVNNPTNSPQYVAIPLNPFVTGLRLGYTYNLYDWTDLTNANFFGQLSVPGNGQSAYLGVSLPAFSTKVIGLDVNDPLTDTKPKPLFASVDPVIYSQWYKSDITNAQGKNKRDWLWGDKPIASLTEPSNFSNTGERKVEYYDKGRFDIADPTADRSNPYYVSVASLAKELIGGRIVFDPDRSEAKTPPQTSVLGDAGSSVTYAALRNVTTLNRSDNVAVDRTGEPVKEYIDKKGNVTVGDNSMPNVQLVSYEPLTGHNVPNVFRDYFRNLPLDWKYMAGLPISEPYLIEVTLGGRRTPALIQVYERRIIAYVPSNDPTSQIISGDIGRHYYDWRFAVPLTNPPIPTAGKP